MPDHNYFANLIWQIAKGRPLANASGTESVRCVISTARVCEWVPSATRILVRRSFRDRALLGFELEGDHDGPGAAGRADVDRGGLVARKADASGRRLLLPPRLGEAEGPTDRAAARKASGVEDALPDGLRRLDGDDWSRVTRTVDRVCPSSVAWAREGAPIGDQRISPQRTQWSQKRSIHSATVAPSAVKLPSQRLSTRRRISMSKAKSPLASRSGSAKTPISDARSPSPKGFAARTP